MVEENEQQLQEIRVGRLVIPKETYECLLRMKKRHRLLFSKIIEIYLAKSLKNPENQDLF